MTRYDEDDLDVDEEEDDDNDFGEDEDDSPSAVFVGMAFSREGCDDCFKVIDRVCKKLGLEALRAHPDDIVGSHNGDDVVHTLMESSDFAIIDLTHERPSVAHEIGMADREFDREFILLIAKKGTPRFANIQARTIHYYADPAELERMVKRQLQAMIEGWNAMDDDDDDGEADAGA